MPNLPISGLPSATTINDADLFAISQDGTTKKFTFQDLTSDIKIIFRKGTNAERLLITPLEGEAIYVTDTKQLYVGDGTTVGGNWFCGGATLNYLSEIFTIRKAAVGTGVIEVETLENTTAATNVLNQNSPALRFKGNAWNTDSSISIPTTAYFFMRSVAGDPPYQELVFRNAGGGEIVFLLDGINTGISVPSITTGLISGVTAMSSDSYTGPGGGTINFDALGAILYNSTTGHVFSGFFNCAEKTIAVSTGDVEINAFAGAVLFAGAATSLVVTNFICTPDSIITATIATNDTTAILGSVVADSGFFTIRMKTAPTSTTRVNFFIVN